MSSGLVVSGKVSGASQVKRKLQSVREALPDIFDRQRLGALMVTRIRERYLKEVSPEGVKWPALAPSSKLGPQILMQTGELFRAIKVLSGARAGRYGFATGMGFNIGVVSKPRTEALKRGGSRTVDPAKYGPAHQLGLGVPKRRFLGINAGDRTAITRLIRRDLNRIISKA